MGVRRRGLFAGVRHFVHYEDGLVTVEWVALCGCVTIGGIAAIWLALTPLETTGQSIGNEVASCHAMPSQLRGQAMADCVHAQNASRHP